MINIEFEDEHKRRIAETVSLSIGVCIFKLNNWIGCLVNKVGNVKIVYIRVKQSNEDTWRKDLERDRTERGNTE